MEIRTLPMPVAHVALLKGSSSTICASCCLPVRPGLVAVLQSFAGMENLEVPILLTV